MECPYNIVIADFCINPLFAAFVTFIVVFSLFMVIILLISRVKVSGGDKTPSVPSEVKKEYYLLQRQIQINITWTGAGPEQILLTNHTNAVATIIFEDQYDVTLPSEVELQPKGHVSLKVEYMPDYFVAIGTLGDGFKDRVEVERP